MSRSILMACVFGSAMSAFTPLLAPDTDNAGGTATDTATAPPARMTRADRVKESVRRVLRCFGAPEGAEKALKDVARWQGLASRVNALLLADGATSRGYKAKKGESAASQSIAWLESALNIPDLRKVANENPEQVRTIVEELVQKSAAIQTATLMDCIAGILAPDVQVGSIDGEVINANRICREAAGFKESAGNRKFNYANMTVA
jgi:hypothetical protein